MARLMRRFVAYLVLAMMVVTTVPVMAVSPPGSLEVPDPEDWGVPGELRLLQATEAEVINELTVVNAANGMLSGVEAYEVPRVATSGPYTLHTNDPHQPSQPSVLQLVPDTPNGTLPGVLQLLLDRPLLVKIYIRNGENINWVDARLTIRPFGFLEIFDIFPGSVDVNVDNDTSTGDAAGNDMSIRLRTVMENRSRDISIIPLRYQLQLRGGLGIEIKRLGPENNDMPIDITVMKSFRYSGINYTWFLEYKVDHIPERGYMSLTAEQVNVTAETGKVMDLISQLFNDTVGEGTRLADVSGPYTIRHITTDAMDYVHATIGYLKIASRGGDPMMEEASWVTARVKPPDEASIVPREFSLWFDSPGFNRTFDHINWTATNLSRLELEYYDDRENNTQAQAIIDAAPTNIRVKISEVRSGELGRVARIHFTSTTPVDLLSFDEWAFNGDDRRKYLHTHVELADLPTDAWLNGTLDVGGQPYELLLPDPYAGSFIPQMLDAVMITLASKLFNIGQTLKSLPENLLSMPDMEGLTTVEFPNPGDHLGRLEMWLTSDHYVLTEPGTDFFAFYNDTVEPEGSMVQTGFSARLMDIRSFHATFKDRKQIVMDSRYNREFRALFIDVKNHANASLWFSNLPHNISLELTDEELIYMGDGTVDRIQYASEIGDQYMKLWLEGVPGGIHFLMGDIRSGVDVLLGEIDAMGLQISNGPVLSMDGDHLLLNLDASGHSAASVYITGLSEIMMDRGDQNTISLKSGGEPFSVLVDDEMEDLHLRANLDPLPSSVEAEVTDMLGLSDISIPSLQDVTSVLDFASIIYSVSELADDVLVGVGEATGNIVAGMGTFSSNLTFSFDGDTNMDLAATIIRGGDVPVPEAPWVHGLWTNMMPSSQGEVLMNSKVYISGISPKGSIALRSSAESTQLGLSLEGFTPKLDHILLNINGSSKIDEGSGKDVWLYMSDLSTPIDLELLLDIEIDVSIGGTVAGDLVLKTSQPMGPLHMRTRIRDENVATVEVVLSNVPKEASLSYSYSQDLALGIQLSDELRLAFLKMTRDTGSMEAPTTAVTFHEMPPLVNLTIKNEGIFDMDSSNPLSSNEGIFDMDSSNPLSSFPSIKVVTNRPGLDILVDIDGRSLGNKADLFMDARNVEELSLGSQDDELRFSAGNLEFLHIGISGLVYGDGTPHGVRRLSPDRCG
jgi:hypothetical protein